jgi:hypothetical protein
MDKKAQVANGRKLILSEDQTIVSPEVVPNKK